MKFVISIQIIQPNRRKARWATSLRLPKAYKTFSNWMTSRWNSGIQNFCWLNNIQTARISKITSGSCNSLKRAPTWNTSKIWDRLRRGTSSSCRPKIGTLYHIWMTRFSLKTGANKREISKSREITSNDTHNSCSKVCRIILIRKWATSTNSTNN